MDQNFENIKSFIINSFKLQNVYLNDSGKQVFYIAAAQK